MKVLVVEPQKPCRVQEIDGLAAMQQIVGGDIEAVYPFQDSAALVCNAEGKLLGLPMNRPLLDEDRLPYDIICGTFFIAGLGQEDFVSLTDEQLQRYKSCTTMCRSFLCERQPENRDGSLAINT